MITDGELEIFLVASPGLEAALCDEAKANGFAQATQVKGGVTVRGGWSEVWRANLEIRGASRVLARIGAFRAFHLAQLDKRARRLAWGEILRPDVPFRVEASCGASRIYHSGAAAQRIETAIREELGAPVSPDAEICIKARIDDDMCTIAVDTSGEPLHKRGFKEAVAKAPMRETMASLFLRQCGFDGTEPVVDPMCGSGTFVIEAAEIAAALKPGRSRHFAFEHLATFDEVAWQRLASGLAPERAEKTISFGLTPDRSPTLLPSRTQSAIRFYGSDFDPGAIGMSRANAARAGVSEITAFRQCAINDLVAPAGPPGLVIVNPPYGTRIGDKQRLHVLYRSLGQTLASRFTGWRVGLVTNEASLAKATVLPFAPPPAPVLHGGIRVTLYLTGALT